MKTYLNLFVLLLFASCSTLNRKTKLLNQSSTDKITAVHSQQLAKETLTILTDSSYNEVEIELLPNGKFNYSLAKGFEGEASKVKIKQKATALHTTQVASKLQLQSNASLQQNQINQIEVREKQVKRLGINWWILSLLLLIIFAWLYRKLIKNWWG